MIVARRDTLLVSLLAFAGLAVFVCMTGASGEGDATLHYLNARVDALQDPPLLLTVWSRPLFKLLVVGPCLVGITAARLTVAAVAAVLVGQTIALARDLKLPRPLLAGVFLLAQPFAFAMAGDVMTEIPAALAFLVAIRLWMHHRRGWSCLVVSFTPLIRPEGFFLIAVWGLLVLIDAWRHRRPPWHGVLLGVGMLTWCLACWIVARKPLYVLETWSWPPGSYREYGQGPLWHHFKYWPWYVGSALLPLFLVGVPFSIRRGMGLPWTVWWLVIGVHSILYWGGWFAALGLLRILVVSAPTTAIVCLIGFNKLGDWLTHFRIPLPAQRIAAVLLLGWVVWTPVDRYRHDPQHHHYKVAWQAAELITSHKLLAPGTKLFVGDQLVLIPLGYPHGNWTFIQNEWKSDRQKELLRSLPPGSIGVWDNRQSNNWYGVAISDLDDLGYERLDTFDVTTYYQSPAYLYRWDYGFPDTVRYVVVRKK